TGWPYADNDELLLQLVGKTPRELLSQDGEAALRESESAALRMGLAMPEPSIVSAAGGTILDPENRRDLQAAGLAVWLKAGPAAIQQRATGLPTARGWTPVVWNGSAMQLPNGILSTRRSRTSRSR